MASTNKKYDYCGSGRIFAGVRILSDFTVQLMYTRIKEKVVSALTGVILILYQNMIGWYRSCRSWATPMPLADETDGVIRGAETKAEDRKMFIKCMANLPFPPTPITEGGCQWMAELGVLPPTYVCPSRNYCSLSDKRCTLGVSLEQFEEDRVDTN